LGKEFFGGGTPSTKNPRYWGGNIAWTTSACIDGLYLTAGAKTITTEGLKNSSSRLVPKNNLLVGTRVGVGKVAINLIDVAISQDLTAVIVDQDAASLEFLAFALSTGLAQDRFRLSTRGTTIKGIPRDDLQRIPIPLPPLKEQRAIAAVLCAVRQAKEATEKVVAATRELKKSLMHHLFTYGPIALDQVDKVPLKETPVGEVPAHWNVGRLDQFIRLQRGFDLPKQARQPGTVPVVSSSGITGYHNEMKIKGPGVVTGRYGSIGEVHFVEGDFWPLNTTLFVTEFFRNDSRYVAYFLTTLNLAAFNDKTSVPGINRNHLHAMTVTMPPLSEQCDIASQLTAIDAKLAVEESRRAALDNLFSSLLHDLMTGKVRVKEVLFQSESLV